MNGHLSDAQFENYRLRRASPAEMAEAANHLAGCADCRETLLRRRADALAAGLAEVRPEHLSYEELEAYVDGRAGGIERELVESHAGWCESCWEQLRMLERCAETMRSAPLPPIRPDLHAEMLAMPPAGAPMQMAAATAPYIAPPTPPPQPPQRRRWPWILAAIVVVLLLLWWFLRR
jgi:hypothetical protein